MAKRLSLDLDRFRQNLDAIETEVAGAHPDVDAPTIVMISKYLDPTDTEQLRAAGFGPLGENRANDLVDKVGVHEDREGWHFVGHIQRNKIAKIVPRVSMIHSVDSERLAKTLDEWVESNDRGQLSCLIEVNIAGETTKGGLTPYEAEDMIPRWVEEFGSLRIAGLMTMAPHIDAEDCRPIFRSLRSLWETIRMQLSDDHAENFSELSMGMSNDYLVAAQEGATMLRIGSALYT